MRFFSISCLTTFFIAAAFAQPKMLDSFDTLNGWEIHKSEGVEIATATAPGKSGDALQLDFNFVKGSGYGGVNKSIPMDLPENFKFTFWVKAAAPVNNFEFKLIDAAGENVWWLNQQNFDFPTEWTKITIKKRHIQFAWGPAQDHSLKTIEKIEFIVASSTGGKGTVWIDELKFEALPPPSTEQPQPLPSVSSNANSASKAANLLDENPETEWRSKPGDAQEIVLDLQKNVEYGGLVIDWDAQDFAHEFDVQISQNQQHWETVYAVTNGAGGRRWLNLKETESRFIRLALKKSSRGKGYAIRDIALRDIAFSETPEAFFGEIAKDFPRGFFPRYFYGEQPYWTAVGVNNDTKEALVGEDGRVEIDKTEFTLEPFVSLGGQLLNWNDVQISQSLAEDYLPVPIVNWRHEKFALATTVFADGEAGKSLLYLNYELKNTGDSPISGNLYLALRPFQVNSPWQFLNWAGGTAKIKSIQKTEHHILVNESKTVVPLTTADAFGAAEFDEGDITAFLAKNALPQRQSLNDHFGYASAALKYGFDLAPGAVKTVRLAVPFHTEKISETQIVSDGEVPERLAAVKSFWASKINTVAFDLPPSGDRIVNTIRSNLAYILINRDGPGIQPGSRSYERSWIRDGSLTSSALLKLGVREEVRDFLNWYAGYQFESGKVPCVVDRRGPDPVPENDSHGQLIFGIYQYFLFTKDTTFLRDNFSQVQLAVEYMDELVAQRMTAEYRVDDPDMRAKFGLLPESISHEGYSAKPMHSFWDDFFAIKGYKDATEIAKILGETELATQFAASRDRFRENLYRSIRLSIEKENINYIPGCVELGDFDATSTAIAIYPCNELKNLPQPFAQNTFDRYFEYFSNRRQPDFEWRDYTPYEVRLIGTFLYLGQPERAHALIDFFFSDQRPAGWNHWAEVVRKGYRTPGFIGDMPHTWVGSDFISAARSMFVYEHEPDQSLVLGAGLYDDWIEKGMSVRGLPTYYGNLDYSIKQSENGISIEIGGDLQLPSGGIRIRNFAGKLPKSVRMNGKNVQSFDKKFVRVGEFPAVVEIKF